MLRPLKEASSTPSSKSSSPHRQRQQSSEPRDIVMHEGNGQGDSGVNELTDIVAGHNLGGDRVTRDIRMRRRVEGPSKDGTSTGHKSRRRTSRKKRAAAGSVRDTAGNQPKPAGGSAASAATVRSSLTVQASGSGAIRGSGRRPIDPVHRSNRAEAILARMQARRPLQEEEGRRLLDNANPEWTGEGHTRQGTRRGHRASSSEEEGKPAIAKRGPPGARK